MNWLAHLLLSETTPEFRIGNILPDLLSASELRSVPGVFAPGVECHRLIDAFTDRHATVRRSIGRLDPAHRRFGGIIIDVFYDHSLAANWSVHCDRPLDDFVRDVYQSFASCRHEFPPAARAVLQRMSNEDWLGSYRTLDGARYALNRIGNRLRNSVRLGECIPEVSQDELHKDFTEFFPLLIAHVEEQRTPAREGDSGTAQPADGRSRSEDMLHNKQTSNPG